MFDDHSLALSLVVFAGCFHFLFKSRVFVLKGAASSAQLAGGVNGNHAILAFFKNPNLVKFDDTLLKLSEVVEEVLSLDHIIHEASLHVDLVLQGFLHGSELTVEASLTHT